MRTRVSALHPRKPRPDYEYVKMFHNVRTGSDSNWAFDFTILRLTAIFKPFEIISKRLESIPKHFDSNFKDPETIFKPLITISKHLETFS